MRTWDEVEKKEKKKKKKKNDKNLEIIQKRDSGAVEQAEAP